MDREPSGAGPSDSRQRIDKWLWFARVVKSRTLARKLVVAGKVRINREKCDSASDLVKPGDVLTIAFDGRIRILRIAQPGVRRGPPIEARLLYEDLSPPDETAAPAPDRKPTGRDRRRRHAFINRAWGDE
jgi:ribosome-associated heat shock protein Hsp15